MKEINGQFIMDCCAPDDPNRLEDPDQLVALLRSVGFLPLFSTSIPGFSVEEHIPPDRWWTGDEDDPWEWRHTLASNPEIAYGKFFAGKAGFIHKDWFPVFASFRRNGYDFDALWNDELAPQKWKKAMDLLDLDDCLIGKPIPASSISEDRIKTDLEMRTYLIISDFEQKRNKRDIPYGLPHAILETPETKWGYDFVTSCYDEGWEKCWDRIKAQVQSLYPAADDKTIWSLLGMRILSADSVVAGIPRKVSKKASKKVPEPKEKLEYPDNLIVELGGIELPLSDDQLAGLRSAISTLLPREQLVLKLRFEEGHTLRAIGASLGVGGTRVGQIIDKALRKLRHPSRFQVIEKGQEEAAKIREEEKRKIKEARSDASLAFAGLKIRTFNCLHRAGIDTTKKLCDIIDNDPTAISNVRNLGLGGVRDIVDVLASYGIEYEGDSLESIAMDLWRGVPIKRKAKQ